MAEQPKKYRAFTGILYPDSEIYKCNEVLDCLGLIFERWCYITHDMDVLETGELKKAHVHWAGYRKAPVTVKTIANALGVTEPMVEFAKRGWIPCAQYLVHLNDLNKFQYSSDSVVSNFDYNGILVSEMSKEDKARGIMNYIAQECIVSIGDVGQWALNNGYWSEFIRAYSFWSKLVIDKNTQ